MTPENGKTRAWDLKAVLEALSGFDCPEISGNQATGELNLVTSSNQGDLVVVGRRNSLKLVNLLEYSPSIIDILCHPQLPSHLQIRGVQFNASGTRLACYGENFVAVATLPRRAASERISASAERLDQVLVTYTDGRRELVTLQDVYKLNPSDAADTMRRLSAQGVQNVSAFTRSFVSCPLYLLGAPLPLEREETQITPQVPRIRCVQWHPLAEAHLGVLDASDCLKIYNTALQTDEPEQVFDVALPDSMYPCTSFCFGPDRGWERFTCLILSSIGDIAALCPVVPFVCTLRKDAIMELQQLSQAYEASGEGGSSQLQWLESCWENLFGDAEAVRSTAWGGIGGESGEGEISELAQWVKYAPGRDSMGPPKLQTHLSIEPKSPIKGVGNSVISTSLCYLKGPSVKRRPEEALPLLLRSYSSGFVEDLILWQTVQPQWQSERRGEHEYAATLLECLDLALPVSYGWPILKTDTRREDLVFCQHSAGVHAITMPCVGQLAKRLHSPIEMAEKPLTPSSVKYVFGVAPRQSVSNARDPTVSSPEDTLLLGCGAVDSPRLGHFLIARSSAGHMEAVNLTIDRYTFTSKAPKLTAIRDHKGGEAGLQPFQEMISSYLDQGVCQKSIVSGSTPIMQATVDSVQFLIDKILDFRNVDLVNMTELAELTNNRHQTLRKLLVTQSNKAKELSGQVDTLQEREKRLQEKVQVVKKLQENLAARAAAVLQAVQENQSTLSKAEREYHEDLRKKMARVQRLQTTVAELTHRTQKLLEAGLPSPVLPKLDQDAGQKCHDLLKAEVQLLAESKEKIRRIGKMVKRINAV